MKHTFVKSGTRGFKHLRVTASLLFLTLLCLVQPSANAQSVVFRPDETFAALKPTTPGQVFFINGNQAHWEDGAPNVPLSGLEKVILSLATLRLQDQELINLDTRLSALTDLPKPMGLYADVPSIHDLLTESAGFATPPTKGLPATPAAQLSTQQFTRYLLTRRAPGKASSPDPVGWAYLERIIQSAADTPLKEALQSLVFGPLGIAADEVGITPLAFSGRRIPLKITLSPTAMTTLLKGIVRNRTQFGAIFLKPASYQVLKAYQDPRVEPYSGFGWGKQQIAGFDVLTLSPASTQNLSLVYIPRADTLFGIIEHDGSDKPFIEAALRLTANVLPSQDQTPDGQIKALSVSSDLSGQFVLVEDTSAWFADRLRGLLGPTMIVTKTQAAYSVRFSGQSSLQYQQIAPYLLSGDESAPDLRFSTYRNGGYVTVEGQLYRRVDSLLLAGRYAMYLPLALVIILSGAVYILQRTFRTIRNMGIAAMTGSLMTSAGLFLDLTYWPHVLYGMDVPSLVVLWRIMLNMGAMLCLSLPLYAFASTRSHTTQGRLPLNPLVRLHMLAIALSAVVLTLLLSAFGILGQFSAI